MAQKFLNFEGVQIIHSAPGVVTRNHCQTQGHDLLLYQGLLLSRLLRVLVLAPTFGSMIPHSFLKVLPIQ